MALCIEPKLTYKGLEATIVASIPVGTLTASIEPEPEKIEASLHGTVVSGKLTASVVSGMVSKTATEGSLRHTAVTATLSPTVVKGVLTSEEHHIEATLTPKAFAEASLTIGSMVEGELKGRLVDGYMAVVCPVNYVTSCFSLGGWDNNLGWDNDKGWKN